MTPAFRITAFYKFHPLSEAEVASVREMLHEAGKKLDICGLVITATEGVNGTIAGSEESIQTFKGIIEATFGETIFKDSGADTQPFKRWFVKIRPEIVTLGDKSVLPEKDDSHLPPAEWNRVMEEEDVVVIDARNTYETEIGMFEGAIDPKISKFQEWPEFVEKSGIPKDKKVLMYCTGGIRCEKALVEMKRHGYNKVYQLSGGILRYIQEFPNEKFEGECFVFDHRVAVNQELKPSNVYGLCPHCGDPGDLEVSCLRCSKQGKICKRCNVKEECRTCSKDCAHQYARKRLQVPA